MRCSNYFCLLLLMLFAACKKDNSNVFKAPDDENFIKDAYGRTLILHGIATSNFSKFSPDHIPWIEESDVQREASYGFNVSRYVISWEAIEPEPGVYNEDYLNKTEERINWYTSRGMYVLLDMHQDLYSGVFGGGGNGAPAWAVRTNGIPIGTYDFGDLWYLQYLTPEVVAAFQNFWKYEEPHKDLQDHYISMWLKVIERFKDNPYVIGYEIMNEPHPGDVNLIGNGQFAKKQLSAFYERAIKAIRAVDQEKWIFFEPEFFMVTGFGYSSELPQVKDQRDDGQPRLVFSPHIYPLGMEAGANYGPLDKGTITEWSKYRAADKKLHKAALFCTEFGGKNDRGPSSEKYLDDFCAQLDELKAGWAGWSHDIYPMIGSVNYNLFKEDRSEYPTLGRLIRTYPRATAGYLRSFKYDAATQKFNMAYISNTDISKPTEIFIPDRHYPSGWNISIQGSERYTTEWNAERQILSIFVNENNREMKISILPK